MGRRQLSSAIKRVAAGASSRDLGDIFQLAHSPSAVVPYMDMGEKEPFAPAISFSNPAYFLSCIGREARASHLD